MLIYSMSVSVDGMIADREGGFEWTAPSEELGHSPLPLSNGSRRRPRVAAGSRTDDGGSEYVLRPGSFVNVTSVERYAPYCGAVPRPDR